MITYRITSKTFSTRPQDNDPDEVRLQRILSRASKKARRRFPVGSTVVFQSGDGREASVIKVYDDAKVITWKGDKPFFIRIKFVDNGQEVLTHSTSLKRVNK